ncbi:hypothetical protein [Tautonia sociabilis]|uniref:Uncharacterized protein n=1 Tax=Tautonia sociabilis TaxID=2080755 RepID=A0A432MC23_9BACT|nr:hypothetical protein [Tautonia sociabilis]RUL81428.1 hypothetical protein TsocGM_25025 [Tautonia sociabilis]
MSTFRMFGGLLAIVLLCETVANARQDPVADARRDTIARQDLRALLLAAQADLRDVEFLYEGGLRKLQNLDYHRVPPENRSPTPRGPDHVTAFQGKFAYRNETFAHLDHYLWDEDGEARRRVSCLPGDYEFQSRSFHLGGGPDGPLASEPGWIGDFFGSTLPLRLFIAPYLLSLLKQEAAFGYECVGWEPVDDRECLKIQLFQGRNRSLLKTFWIDLERQGHPLRYECKVAGQLLCRISDVTLEEVPTRDGKKVWLPIKSQYDHFCDLITYSDRPVIEETFGVVRGSLLINQDLPDSRFSIDYRPTEGPKPPLEAVAEVESVGPRTVDEQLDELIKVADRQAAELTASAPSREPWIHRHAGQLGMYALGVVLISLAIAVRLRGAP